MIAMNHEDYKRIWLGEFVPDERYLKLVDRLNQYYRDTPDSMSNQDALPHWKAFKTWCNQHGYTQEELNQAKRRY